MDYIVRTADQLKPILKAFRKNRGLSQIDLAKKLGVTQQALSLLEADPNRASFERLLTILGILDVEIILCEKSSESISKNELW